MQTFIFDSMYRESKRTAHVDFLSRNPTGVDPIKFDKIKEKIVNLAEISEDWLLAGQRRNSQILEIVKGLQNDGLAEDIANTCELRSGTL